MTSYLLQEDGSSKILLEDLSGALLVQPTDITKDNSMSVEMLKAAGANVPAPSEGSTTIQGLPAIRFDTVGNLVRDAQLPVEEMISVSATAIVLMEITGAINSNGVVLVEELLAVTGLSRSVLEFLVVMALNFGVPFEQRADLSAYVTLLSEEGSLLTSSAPIMVEKLLAVKAQGIAPLEAALAAIADAQQPLAIMASAVAPLTMSLEYVLLFLTNGTMPIDFQTLMQVDLPWLMEHITGIQVDSRNLISTIGNLFVQYGIPITYGDDVFVDCDGTMPMDHIADLNNNTQIMINALGSLKRDAPQSVESLLAVVALSMLVVEEMYTAAQAILIPLEWLASIKQDDTVKLEGVTLLKSDVQVPVQTVANLTVQAMIALEKLMAVIRDSAVPVQTLTNEQLNANIPLDFFGNNPGSYFGIPAEHLMAAKADAVVAMEKLMAAAVNAKMLLSTIGNLTIDWPVPFEHVQDTRGTTFTLALEHLMAVNSNATIAMAFWGLGVPSAERDFAQQVDERTFAAEVDDRTMYE